MELSERFRHVRSFSFSVGLAAAFLLAGPLAAGEVASLDGLTPALIDSDTGNSGGLQTIDNVDTGWDKLDVTFTVTVDFESKADGDRETIYEAGARSNGMGCYYEAPNTIAVLARSGGGAAAVRFELPAFLRNERDGNGDLVFDGPDVDLAWTFDVDNGEGLQKVCLIVNGAIVACDTEDLAPDWTNNNAVRFGNASNNPGGVPSGDTVDFSGVIRTQADPPDGLKLYSDTLLIPATTESDSDGLADEWEMVIFGNLDQPGTADFDGDGLDNLGEFERLTDPRNTDTDGDGLQDGEEVATLGTDPNDPDTDRDGRTDSDELNVDPKTDPLVADTDGDQFVDGAEVAASPSSDPTDPTSVPAEECVTELPAEITEIRNNTTHPDPATLLGEFEDYSNNADDADGDGNVDHAAKYDQADATFTLLIDLDDKLGGEREVIWETGGSGVGFSLVYEAKNTLVLRASGDGTAFQMERLALPQSLVDGGEVEIAWTFDVDHAGIQTIKLFVNGIAVGVGHRDLGADWSGTNNASFGEDTSGMAGSGTGSDIRGIDFASGTINLDQGLRFYTGVVLCTDETDTDSDGIPDALEGLYSTDLATLGIGDADGDTLNDIDELDLGLNPTLADTDGDTLSDSVELNSTLTDPVNPDTDLDTLTDSEELAADPATDPLLADTDGDGLRDDLEVNAMTDPTDFNSRPLCIGRDASDCPDPGNLPGQDCVDIDTLLATAPTEVRTTFGRFEDYANSTDDRDMDGNPDHAAAYQNLDATFAAIIDFDPKTEGERELIWETGGGTNGFSLTYETGNKLVLRTSGGDGFVLLTLVHDLSDDQVNGGNLEIAWTYDRRHLRTQVPGENPEDPPVNLTHSTVTLFVDRQPVAMGVANTGVWSGANDASFGTETTGFSASGLDSDLRGEDFTSGTIDLTTGLLFWADAVACSGIQCPEQGDTTCTLVEITPPAEGNVPGTYTATATAEDAGNDPFLSYTFTATNAAGGDPIVVGPREDSTATFDLTEGDWTISVVVDDDPFCDDPAATCPDAQVTVAPPGGLQVPGDCDQNGKLQIGDAICVFGVLFQGSPPRFPCGELGLAREFPNILMYRFEETPAEPGARNVDITDGINILNFLFLGGIPHPLAVPGQPTSGCVPIIGCPDSNGCAPAGP